MQESEKRIAKEWISEWRKTPQLLYLAQMPLFDIDYWEKRKRIESEQEEITEIQDFHTEIEQIWIFCILMDEKNSPIQKYRKNEAMKLSYAIELSGVSEVLAVNLRDNSVGFVNEIRAYICIASYDSLWRELIMLYKRLHQISINMGESTSKLDVESKIKVEKMKGEMQMKEFPSVNNRIEELEVEMAKKNETVRKVIHTEARELATSMYYESSSLGVGQGNEW